MSKKNKSKFKNSNQPQTASQSTATTGTTAAKPQTAAGDDTMKEFRHLAIIIAFILLLLCTINYYNEKAGILSSFTDKLYSLI